MAWKNKGFVLIDMAGIEPALELEDEISTGMQRQVEAALRSADLIVWVVDGVEGVTHLDERVAELLRRLGKPVLVVANKTDNEARQMGRFEFMRFGFIDVLALSALHGNGFDEFLDAVIANLPENAALEEGESVDNPRELRLAILGRPNVGKSTLLNTLSNEERAVVSPISGTTRDTVDTVLPSRTLFGRTYTKWSTVRVIDTAGMRRAGKIEKGKEGIEGYSVIRSLETLDRAEVVLFLLDGTEGIVHQDLQVSQKIVDAGRPLVLVVNKWDQVLEKHSIIAGTPEDDARQEEFLDQMRQTAPFLFWAPVLFISAKELINVSKIGKLVLSSYNAWSATPSVAILEEVRKHLVTLPRMGSIVRIELTHSCPPTFHVHVQGRKLLHFSVRRQIEHVIREVCEIGPSPIKIWVETEANPDSVRALSKKNDQ